MTDSPRGRIGLIVEEISSSDRLGLINKRVSQFLRGGVPLLWLVSSDEREVIVFQRGGRFKVLDAADALDGEEVPPDLRLRVGELFTSPDQPRGD